MCIWSRSRCQLIFSTLEFYSWPLQGQLRLFLVCTLKCKPQSFLLLFSNSHHSFLRPRSRCQSNLSGLQFPFLATRGPSLFFLVCTHQSRVCPLHPLVLDGSLFKVTPNIHWAMVKTQVHFHHPLVTFVATRESTLFFLVFTLQSRVFNRSSNPHIILL